MSERRSMESSMVSSSVADVLGGGAREKKQGRGRGRGWEKKQRRDGRQVTYRLPAELNEAVRSVAHELGVPVREVVQRFLEYGLEDYQSGRLQLDREPVQTAYTLYPRD